MAWRSQGSTQRALFTAQAGSGANLINALYEFSGGTGNDLIQNLDMNEGDVFDIRKSNNKLVAEQVETQIASVLSLRDANLTVAPIEDDPFIIRQGLFDKRIYNVVTENLTVQEIIDFIERRIGGLDIDFVDSPILNQLSYEMSNRRFVDKGFEFA